MKDISCLDCIYFNFEKWGTCKGFPKGIPFAITSGEVSHHVIFKGQGNKFVFKRKDK